MLVSPALHGRPQTFAPYGAQEENRTPDLRITSALLYRLSYLGEDPKCYGSIL